MDFYNNCNWTRINYIPAILDNSLNQVPINLSSPSVVSTDFCNLEGEEPRLMDLIQTSSSPGEVGSDPRCEEW